MTNTSLTIPFANTTAIGSYWLIMQPVEVTDTASLADVATVFDVLYEINTCEEQDDQADDTEDENEPLEITAKDLDDTIKSVFKSSFCLQGVGFEYNAQLRIWRSHDEPYRLRLSNGNVIRTVRQRDAVSTVLTLNGATSATLPSPVASGLAIKPSGILFADGEQVRSVDATVNGLSVEFGAVMHGALLVSYTTEYDLVSVLVHGLDTHSTGCQVIAFYHGMAIEAEISPPEGMDVDWNERARYCNRNAGDLVGSDNEDDITCWEDVTKQYRCRCTGEIAYEIKEKVVCPCPDGLTKCTLGLGSDAVWDVSEQRYRCSARLGSRTELADYIECSEYYYNHQIDIQVTNPENSILSKSEYYIEKCCHEPENALPVCAELYEKNRGGQTLSDKEKRAYRLRSDYPVEFVGISPVDGDCGTIKTVLNVAQRNCCGDVAAITWDAENSAEVISDYSYGIVVVTGGRLPLNVSVRGSGFYLDAMGSMRDGIVDGRAFKICTINSCGSCEVTITDGCSICKQSIRSSVGSWYTLSDFDGSYNWSGFSGIVDNSDASNIGWKASKLDTLQDKIIGRYGLVYSDYYSGNFTLTTYPQPGVNKQVQYTTSDHGQHTSCSPYGMTYQADPVVGAFQVPIGSGSTSNSTVTICGTGPTYIAYLLYAGVRIMEWKC